MSTQYELKTLPLGEVLSQVKPPEKYVREKIDNELVEELRESIEKIGLKTPIIVDKDGIIIDGVHRYEALKKISKRDLQVPIIVLKDVSYSEEPERAIWLAYLVNRYRTGGADDQFNKQLLKETIAKLVLLVLKNRSEKSRIEVLKQLEESKIPRWLVEEIRKITGTSYRTARRWIESLLEPSKEEFISWLKRELGIENENTFEKVGNGLQEESVTGAPDGAVHQSHPTTEENVNSRSESILEKVVSKSPDPSKAEYIIRIREKVPDVDVERLNKLSKRMLQVLARKVESGQIDEVRRLLSEGNSSSSENAVAGSATTSTAGSKLGLNQHTNQSTSHDDSSTDATATNNTGSNSTGGSDEESKHVDQDTKIEVEESQSSANTTAVAVVVEESREKPEEENRIENEKVGHVENVREEQEEQSQGTETRSEVEGRVESRSEGSEKVEGSSNSDGEDDEYEEDYEVTVSAISVKYAVAVLRLFRELFEDMEKKLCKKCRGEIYRKWQVLLHEFLQVEKWVPDRPIRTPHDLAEDAVEALLVELRRAEKPAGS